MANITFDDGKLDDWEAVFLSAALSLHKIRAGMLRHDIQSFDSEATMISNAIERIRTWHKETELRMENEFQEKSRAAAAKSREKIRSVQAKKN